MMGGPPAWTGGGAMLRPSNGQNFPGLSTGAPVQSDRMTPIASSVRGPRSAGSTWQPRNSAGYSPPTPTPIATRPPVSTSSSAACLATITGWYSGASRTAVPTVARSDSVASVASPVIASGTSRPIER